MAGILDYVTPFNPNQSLRIGGMSGTDQGGILGALNNPLLGLAAGLLSGRDPGGTFASGLNQGLVNMQGMQHAALQGGLLKAQLDEIERKNQDRERMRQAMGGFIGAEPTEAGPYQMSDAELFPGESQIPGLMNAGSPGSGLLGNPETAGLGGLLQAMPEDVQGQFLAQYALQQAKPLEDRRPADLLAYQQAYGEEEGFRRWEQSKLPQRSAPDPYFTPIYTPDGVVSFNARSGQAAPLMLNGTPIVGAQYSPELQGQITGAKKGAEITATDQTQRQVNLPNVVAKSSYALKLLDDLKTHPGLGMAVGKSSVVPVIPGTQQADFVTRLDQIQGQNFLQAFESLKGGGQITQIEGEKATAAIGRLSRAQTEEEFKKSVDELQQIISTGVDRAARGVTVDQPNATQQKVRRFNPQTGMIE